jgi:hypothetical protein
MFGNNFKYVLVLGLLAAFTYTNPAVLDSISSGIAYNNQQAAIWDAFFMHRNAPQLSSTTTMNTQRPSVEDWRGGAFASTTRPIEAMASSSDRVHRILPQEVVTILFKAGIIPSDKLDQARKIIGGLEIGTSTDRTRFGTTTMGTMIREQVREHVDGMASSTYGDQ